MIRTKIKAIVCESTCNTVISAISAVCFLVCFENQEINTTAFGIYVNIHVYFV